GSQVFRFLESNDAGKGNVAAQLKRLLRQPETAAETMHDRGKPAARPMRFQYLNCLSLSLARMNYRWKISIASKLELTPKDFQLRLARRIVVVEVESNFAPCDNARTLLYEP